MEETAELDRVCKADCDESDILQKTCNMNVEAVVEFEYVAEQEDELTLKVGDIITNVQTAEGGWWEGELNGKKGMFPENFVKLVKRREPAPNKKEEKREATQRKSVRELASKLGGVPMGVPPKKKDKKKKCKVLFEYKKENDDELELAVGDILDFHRQVEEGWWEGALNGRHGVFPSNFVEMVDDTASPDESSSISTEEKDKSGDTQSKDSDFHTIKGKKVIGVGLGNIFGGGPIKLRAVGDGGVKEDAAKSARPGDSTPDSAPEAAKREKQNTTERAVVRFSYTAEQPDELSLVEGQIVRILEKELEDEGWWKGEINGKIGVFPDNFVELLPNDESSKPKKPPPPAAVAKQAVHPKLSDKTSVESIDDKIKAEPQPPSIGKKPQAPPPIGKKPLNQKSLESKPEPGIPNKPAGTVKEKPSGRENHTENQNSDGATHFDDIEPAGQKLTHLTYGRAKGPKKRPPSTVLILNEGEKDGDFPEETKNSHSPAPEKHSHLPEKPDKPFPILPPKDTKHQPQLHTEKESTIQTPHHPLTPSLSRERESQAPPPRPPEPTTAPPSSASSTSSIQFNKLIEQLQREINELKTHSVSKTSFNELRVEHEKLKSDFENLKNNHSSKIRDLMNEVDEEKKLRLTTQVEIERVKKLVSETHV